MGEGGGGVLFLQSVKPTTLSPNRYHTRLPAEWCPCFRQAGGLLLFLSSQLQLWDSLWGEGGVFREWSQNPC